MVRYTDDPFVLTELTRHTADEARHAWLWQNTIAQLELPPVRIYRSYQSFYATEGTAPQTLAEVLALTHVFEHRVDREFSSQLDDRRLPNAVHRTFRALLRDEERHLDWVAKWLRERPEFGPLVDRYYEIDSRVAEQLRPYRDRLWDVAGLGDEIVPAPTLQLARD
jgi:rubrerythrin